MTEFDVVVVGGGPAGLSAALNLVRARATVLLVDAGRPRNAATLRSHGYLTRDGVSPAELRSLGRAELAAYPDAQLLDRVNVTRIARLDDGFLVETVGRTSASRRSVRADTVLLATGLRETLPDLPSLRSYYGMSVFSCVACDAWDLRDAPLALIGQTHDLHERAVHLARWSDNLTVFTNGSPVLGDWQAADLVGRGIRVESAAIDDLVGHRGSVSGVRLADGRTIPITGGFVRPLWQPILDPLDGIELELHPDGFVNADADGRTGIPGLFVAGDIASPGPQQLIIAAGAGARTAAAIVRAHATTNRPVPTSN